MTLAEALRVRDLHKTYADGTHALRGLDLTVPAGCFFGLLGPNGSGKTTLIGMAVGLVRSSSAGTISVFGHDALADAGRARQAFVATIVLTPLALVAGVFYSAAMLSEPWATLTRLNPLYHLVDAARAGFTGFHEANVAASLGLAALAAALAFGLATALIARGWRLKP